MLTPIDLSILFKQNRDTVKRDSDTQQINAALLVFDQPESLGTIIIERVSSGIYIHINGRCLALIDLYACGHEYQANVQPEEPRDYPQIIFYTGNDGDDPLGHVRWFANQCQAEFAINRILVPEEVFPWHSTYMVPYEDTQALQSPKPKSKLAPEDNAAFKSKHPAIFD